MGGGIVTANGASPLDEWRLRLGNLGSHELTEAVRDLLSGKEVVTTEGSLEISALATGTASQRLTVRIPEAPFVADLYVEPLDVGAPVELDDRSAFPCPDRWITDAETASARWELFNCRVVSLQTRSNVA